MSSFRLICIVALSTLAAAGTAAAQIAMPTDQSGKPYLAGLPPPHDHRRSAHPQTSRLAAQHKPLATSTRLASKRQQVATAKIKSHRPVRLADKINSRVAWPNVEPPAADGHQESDTVLQFATEEAAPNPAPPPRPAASSPASTVKNVPPTTIAATDERKADPDVTGATPSASTPVQTERFEAPPSTQMRVILPATNAEPLAASAPADQPAANSSTTAQMLATLAGGVTAGIVGWLLVGFGPFRTIRSRQT